MPKDARQKLVEELNPAPAEVPRLLGGLRRLKGEANSIGFSLVAQQAAATVAVFMLIFLRLLWGVATQGQQFDLNELNTLEDSLTRYDTVEGLLVNLLAYVVSMLLPFLLLCFLLRRHPLRTVPLRRIQHARWLSAALVAALGLSFLSALVTAYIESMLSAAHISVSGPDFTPPSQPHTIALYILLFCVVAPICEEFIFRGVLLQSLRPYGNGFAVLTTALLFSMMHGNIEQMPLAFLLGLALGFAVLFFESIWATVLMHACVNLFSTVISLLSLRIGESAGNLIYFGLGAALLAMFIVTFVEVQRGGGLRRLFASWPRPALPATYLLKRVFTAPGMLFFTVVVLLLCISGLKLV